MASLFAIFTGQAWNMTLGFYHSLITLPGDLNEASKIYKLNPWQKFSRLELPNSAISLIWNSMMSFGGGWFFVVQSEMITVLNKNIKLPGIGSYMGMALEKGDKHSAFLAVIAMIVTIILIDQLFWKPITVWSQKFKNEQVDSNDSLTSTVFSIISKSKLANNLFDYLMKVLDVFFGFLFKLTTLNLIFKDDDESNDKQASVISIVFKILFLLIALYLGVEVLKTIISKFNFHDLLHVFYLGSITMLRVAVMVVISTLIWTPIGVWVGLKPKLSRYVRPFAQVGASFPINMTFPILVGFFIQKNISINWGSILLLSLGAQWYILFNIIAGASSIPSDMKESAQIFKLKGIKLWRNMIIPAIFPYWVTGACTAAGGAWNASIVAEYANFGNQKLIATGLGAYITQVTNDGNWNGIFLSIATMSFFVVVINRLVWRKLYKMSEEKFHLE
jgi:NitT/TauT family transport system permease protein